jgi:hypothetical protein
LLAAQGRKVHLKVTSWGGGKVSQLIKNAAFLLLPSLAASCVVVFLLFEISKLENLAIKLVEIGSEKHKFPNLFFVEKGKSCFQFCDFKNLANFSRK